MQEKFWVLLSWKMPEGPTFYFSNAFEECEKLDDEGRSKCEPGDIDLEIDARYEDLIELKTTLENIRDGRPITPMQKQVIRSSLDLVELLAHLQEDDAEISKTSVLREIELPYKIAEDVVKAAGRPGVVDEDSLVDAAKLEGKLRESGEDREIETERAGADIIRQKVVPLFRELASVLQISMDDPGQGAAPGR